MPFANNTVDQSTASSLVRLLFAFDTSILLLYALLRKLFARFDVKISFVCLALSLVVVAVSG